MLPPSPTHPTVPLAAVLVPEWWWVRSRCNCYGYGDGHQGAHSS